MILTWQWNTEKALQLYRWLKWDWTLLLVMNALCNGTRLLYRKSLKVCDDSYPPSSWLYPKPNYTLCVDKLFPRMLNLLLIFAYIISSFMSKLYHIQQSSEKRKLETFVFSIGGRGSDESLSHNRSLQLSHPYIIIVVIIIITIVCY